MMLTKIKNHFEKLVIFLFKIKYIGLYFWSNPHKAREKATDIVISDLLMMLLFFATIIIICLLKLGFIPTDISVKHIPNARIITLSILGLIIILIAALIFKSVEKVIKKEKYANVFDLTQFTKKSALPYFLFTLFDPLLWLIFFGIFLKSVNYFLF